MNDKISTFLGVLGALKQPASLYSTSVKNIKTEYQISGCYIVIFPLIR